MMRLYAPSSATLPCLGSANAGPHTDRHLQCLMSTTQSEMFSRIFLDVLAPGQVLVSPFALPGTPGPKKRASPLSHSWHTAEAVFLQSAAQVLRFHSTSKKKKKKTRNISSHPCTQPTLKSVLGLYLCVTSLKTDEGALDKTLFTRITTLSVRSFQVALL